MSLSLTQQEKEVLFKVVIVMIEHVNIYFKKVVFSIQVHAFTVSFKKKKRSVSLSLPPVPVFSFPFSNAITTYIFKCSLVASQEVL